MLCSTELENAEESVQRVAKSAQHVFECWKYCNAVQLKADRLNKRRNMPIPVQHLHQGQHMAFATGCFNRLLWWLDDQGSSEHASLQQKLVFVLGHKPKHQVVRHQVRELQVLLRLWLTLRRLYHSFQRFALVRVATGCHNRIAKHFVRQRTAQPTRKSFFKRRTHLPTHKSNAESTSCLGGQMQLLFEASKQGKRDVLQYGIACITQHAGHDSALHDLAWHDPAWHDLAWHDLAWLNLE